MNMKEFCKKILNWRTWVLSIIFSASLILLVCDPMQDENYWAVFFISKAIGVALYILTAKLAVYFNKKGTLNFD